MCGIFGGVALTHPFENEAQHAIRRLAHRGPDGQGLVNLGDVVLAHSRLRVIDLSHAADQPLWDDTRRAVIVFNGEIYNYRELRDECVRNGMHFRSASDTEVIVNQYLLHGESAFDRLDGMFAFCLYDRIDQTAFLVRDPFGIKPLYYAVTNRGILFSSEIQSLLQLQSVSSEIDPVALQAYLRLDFVPSPMTILKAVRKLEGGHVMKASKGSSPEIRRYARPRLVPSGSVPGPLQEFSRRIDAAVERQLVSDVPVGVFLSGGIDSTIIAAVATKVAGHPIDTFSIAFDDPSFDESEYFGIVADLIGTNHHVRALSPHMMLDLIPRVASHFGEPLADGSVYPTWLLAEFAREHVTVALSGDGADELFGGYPTYRAHSLVQRMPAALVRGAASVRSAAHRWIPVRYDNFSPDYELKKFLDGLDVDLITRHMRWMGTFTLEELPELLVAFDPSAQTSLDDLLRSPSMETGDGWLERALRTDQRFYLQDGVLVKVDRASMASSLEVRVPFLDREVVELADVLPPGEKLRGHRTKPILRDYVGDRFPAVIAQRRKKGFGVPLGRWFRGELRPLLEDVLGPRKTAEQGFFRPKFVQRLLEDHWSGRRDNRKQIFNLLTFSLWYDNVIAASETSSEYAK
ncbi:MAG TPA: asparagine synthase (glutamine-hydrolyzing) [Thermoanaerobaculia bacterium]|nr:asparagine synthase (glutamine-hydrolyzing) [Thermoanaerobaculia bacterium]